MADLSAPPSPLSDARSDISNIFTPRKTALYSDIKVKPEDSSTLRISRKRVAPKRLEDETEELPRPKRIKPDLIEPYCANDTRLSSPSAMPSAQKQPVRGNWSVSHLMTNPKSKFATINLHGLLKHDRAWTELSREQQEELISMIPGASVPHMPEDEPLPNVLPEFLRSNRIFSTDVGLFQKDLEEGRYDRKWLEDAQVAMQKRANGDFDAWKEKNKEEFWGQKQKFDWSGRAGDSSQHDLRTLVEARYVEIGDIWLFRRVQGRGPTAVAVEKEATITGVSPEHLLSFRFSPGEQNLQSHDAAIDNDIRTDNVDGPHTLSKAILDEDGRLAGLRSSNAWKDFRCIRKNQDMGTLWDIRDLYHSRLKT